MKIFVTGTRGIPDIPGGVETHCQELYPRIAAKGHDVIIATRKTYISKRYNTWRNVRLCDLFSPRKKSFEAIVHTFLAVIKARQFHADILHIHAIGPALLAPLARLLGCNVVITHHGPDYDRQKWGIAAKLMLRLGERLGIRFANNIIVISRHIAEIVNNRNNRHPHLIYNGVTPPIRKTNTSFLSSYSVKPGKYILSVARFVPEKGLHDLIEAFQLMDTKYKLIIAGDADHETPYSRKLKRTIDKDENIIRTGYVTGEPLQQLFSNARLFVLPSHHEGLPIVMLEAMSYGLSVLASDIPANLEVPLSEKRYFRCADVISLKNAISYHLSRPITPDEITFFNALIKERYNWDKTADKTIAVYEETLGQKLLSKPTSNLSR